MRCALPSHQFLRFLPLPTSSVRPTRLRKSTVAMVAWSVAPTDRPWWMYSRTHSTPSPNATVWHDDCAPGQLAALSRQLPAPVFLSAGLGDSWLRVAQLQGPSECSKQVGRERRAAGLGLLTSSRPRVDTSRVRTGVAAVPRDRSACVAVDPPLCVPRAKVSFESLSSLCV